MTDELKQWDYDRGYDKGKADMLKVIEDIKAEIAHEISLHNHTWFRGGMIYCLNILDKHIGKESE